MRKRTKDIKIRLNDEEFNFLNSLVAKTAYNRQNYLRLLINRYQPIERPTVDTIACLQELRKIGINMNQIAYKANALNLIDKEAFFKSVQDIQVLLVNFMESTMLPKPFNHGHNSDLGC